MCIYLLSFPRNEKAQKQCFPWEREITGSTPLGMMPKNILITAVLFGFCFCGNTVEPVAKETSSVTVATVSLPPIPRGLPGPLRNKVIAARKAIEESGDMAAPLRGSLNKMLSNQHQGIPGVAFCFAPGTSEAYINSFYQANAPLFQNIRFGPGSGRWTSTATDGSGIAQATPLTITWGIVADGATIDNGNQSNLRAFLNGIYGSQATWQALMQEVFDRWAEITPITYVFEAADDGAGFGQNHSPGVRGVRADVRIGGMTIDGPSGTLAYNYYPNNGDMVIDTGDTFYNDTANNSLKFRNVFAHEHGHGLGFAHTCPVEQSKLMEPFASTAFDGPQHDDILAAQRQYGDRFGNNNSSGAASVIGTGLSDGIHTTTNMSLSTSTDVDFFRFTTGQGGRKVTLTLAPTGLTYLEGPQNADSSCSAGTSFNSAALRNLGLEILDSNGSTVLASADLTAAGSDEVLSNVQLGGGTGPFFIRVFGNAVDQVQIFSLQLELSDGAPAPEIAVLGNGMVINSGDTTPSTNDFTDFGLVLAGSSTTNTYSITNEGNLDLTITTPITISGAAAGDFSIPAQPSGTVPAGTSVSFDVIFTPSGSGARNASISIINNDATENPYTYSILGTGGVTPEIGVYGGGVEIVDGDNTSSVTDQTDFGTVDILSGSAQSTFVISNTGSAALNLTLPVTITGSGAGDFSIVTAPTNVVATGTNTTFIVRFDPSAVGTSTATVTINNDDLNESTYDFVITGSGTVAPEIEIRGNGQVVSSGDVTPAAADGTDYGSADILTGSNTRTYVLTNIGSATLNLSLPVVLSGANASDFVVTSAPSTPRS